jgi:serine O-acetyltransferase
LGNNVVIGAGAKILGPITLGNDVRVGSNSVVVKSVDNSQTVVGVPARLLKDSKVKTNHFESYAVGEDIDDPTVKAINSILTHIHKMDEQLNIVSNKLDIKDQTDINVDDLEIESK